MILNELKDSLNFDFILAACDTLFRSYQDGVCL